ncbi:phospholipase A2 family protein, partial [Bacillus badius]|uniref:phospholipase A2 family protein n=1 Tax=Bacillus badius TaxID=1455 RepID=UPI002E24BD30
LSARPLATENAPLSDAELLNADKQLETYIYYKEGQPYIDLEKAKNDGLEEEYIEIGTMVNQISDQMINYSDDQTNEKTIKKAKISIPVWGNWCGSGHGSGTPKDVLDAGCKAHDKCYGDRHYFSCACDKALVNYIDKYFSKMKLKEKAAAVAIKTYFKNTLCVPI